VTGVEGTVVVVVGGTVVDVVGGTVVVVEVGTTVVVVAFSRADTLASKALNSLNVGT